MNQQRVSIIKEPNNWVIIADGIMEHFFLIQ